MTRTSEPTDTTDLFTPDRDRREKAGTPAPLLDIRDLDVTFSTSAGPVPAVRGANLTVYPGQTVAIVGESGEYSPRWGPLIEGSGATSLP
ncbi:ABC-type multidrug transport system fused ATPase/permease subunit [Brachybacterium muris]|nr:ABC-type multidrug transport system fused ATPase/permease subunit [Brachybacterium muris]